MLTKKEEKLLHKLNPHLQELILAENTHDYERAKKAFNDICVYASAHGLTSKIDGVDKINYAISTLPHEGEITVNIRVSKEQILNDKRIAKFISGLFDLEDNV